MMRKVYQVLIVLFVAYIIVNLTVSNFTGSIIKDIESSDYVISVGESIKYKDKVITPVFVNTNLAGNAFALFNIEEFSRKPEEITIQAGETRKIMGLEIELKKVRPFIINSETRKEAVLTLGIKDFIHPDNGRYQLIEGESFLLNNSLVKLQTVQKRFAYMAINGKMYIIRPNEEKTEQGINLKLISHYYNTGIKAYNDPSNALLIILPA